MFAAIGNYYESRYTRIWGNRLKRFRKGAHFSERKFHKYVSGKSKHFMSLKLLSQHAFRWLTSKTCEKIQKTKWIWKHHLYLSHSAESYLIQLIKNSFAVNTDFFSFSSFIFVYFNAYFRKWSTIKTTSFYKYWLGIAVN